MVNGPWLEALGDSGKKAPRAEEEFKVGVLLVTRFRNAFHHVLNPLHVYCRLKDFGISGRMAKRMTRAYERYVFRLLP